MSQKRSIEVDEHLRELSPHGTLLLPLQVNYDDLSRFENGYVRCHWHEEFELSVVRKGRARYRSGLNTLTLNAGEGVLINSNVPHAMLPDGEAGASLQTVIVHPAFLYGFRGSAIETGLLRPFLSAEALALLPLEPAEIEACRRVADLYAEKPFAWELECKGTLCLLLSRLIARSRSQLDGSRTYTDVDLKRLEALLTAVSQHLDEPLSLPSLARLAGLSRSACCRFFKRMTGQTLSQYQEDCRITRGLQLLNQGDLPITDVALLCGYTNPGRFSAAFARRMHCTPRAYLSEKRPT